MEYSIKTNNGELVYRLVRRKMKHIRIRVTGEMMVVVLAPNRCAENVIHTFVRDNEAFIRRQLNALEAQRMRYYPAAYVNGDVFSLLGRQVRLCVLPATRARSVFRDGLLTIYVPQGGSAKAQFIRWLTGQARILFAQRLESVRAGFSGSTGLTVSVKRMLTRWGSINPARRRLSLSVHLMRCEPELIDYVITHELCHLGCSGHSPAFYRALEARCPNRRELDKRLAAYGLVDF